MNEQNNLQKNTSVVPENKTKTSKTTKSKKVWAWVLSIFSSLIVIAVVSAIILVQVGKGNLLNRDDVDLQVDDTLSDIEIGDDNTVIYEGQKYIYNENVAAVLFIGVDKSDFYNQKSSTEQADALFLATIDTKTGRTTIIPIPRDSMAEIDVYSDKGEYLGVERSQICLSYAYKGENNSGCENTLKAVSRMFYGMPIKSYVSIDMGAIEVLSDKVGGVDVVLTEDVKLYKTWYKKGQKLNLRGYEARNFVLYRENDLEASLKRMSRQKQFINSFASKVIEKTKKNIKTPVTIFNSIKPYMVTNLDVADVSFLTSCFMKTTGGNGIEYKSISGEATKPGEYVEYICDSKSIYDIIIDVFYLPTNE